MKKKLLFLSLCGFVLFSCNNELEDVSVETPPQEPEFIVIRERNPDIPLILSMPRQRAVTRSSVNLEFEDYLGMSFKTDYYPFESILNVGTPVIDIRKLREETDQWATSRPYRYQDPRQFAYHGFDRYEVNSSIARKVSSGFSINLGLFKIGKKKTMTEVFTESIVTQSTTVMGQVDVDILDKIYDLTLNSNRIRQVNEHYLHPDFLLDLYHMPIGETFNFYGGFVLSKFLTGGRATALYTGTGRSYSSSQELENEMTKSMQASFGHKKDSVNGELGFGKKYGNGSSLSSKVSQFKTSVKTIGGSYGSASFTIAKDFETVDVNLTPWMQSLNDPTTHTIVNVADEGLVPLSAFIMEENLKKWIDYCYTGQPHEYFVDRLYEPRLIMNGLDIFLTTRFQRLAVHNEYSHVIHVFSGNNLLDCMDFMQNVFPDLGVGSYVRITGVSKISDITHFKKIIDRVNNKTYLLYEDDKVGLSIHLGYNTYLLDTYTIRDMVENMPESEFNYNELLNYTLIAL